MKRKKRKDYDDFCTVVAICRPITLTYAALLVTVRWTVGYIYIGDRR